MKVTVKTMDDKEYIFTALESGDVYVTFGRHRGLVKGRISGNLGGLIRFSYYKENRDYSYGEEPKFVITKPVTEFYID